MLTKNEWKLLGGLCIVLKEFAEAITYLGASKYVTHSIMSPLLKKIKKYIKPENTRSQNIDIEKIADIFAEKEKEETLISVLLDPKIKSLEFIDDNEVCNKIKDLLKNKYNQLKADFSLIAPATSSILLFGQSSLFSIFK